MIAYEYQRRYVGLGWQPSNPKVWPLDPPNFSNEEWKDVGQVSQPAWDVVIDDTTDEAGWHYAYNFPDFTTERNMGRSTQRAMDWTRRRTWKAVDSDQCCIQTKGMVSSKNTIAQSLTTLMQEGHNTRALFEGLFNQSTLSTQDIFLDPTAILRVGANHQELYTQFLDGLEKVTSINDSKIMIRGYVAACYARAAYGRIMEDHWMKNQSSVVQLHTVGAMGFDVRTGIDNKSNTDSFLRMAGIQRKDLLYVCWSAPAHFIAVDHEMKWIVVSVRGTVSNTDAITNLKIKPVPYMHGHAHDGFLITSSIITQAVMSHIDAAKLEYPEYELVVTGHSLGGSVATLVAIHLTSMGYKLRCYGFGSAAVVSNPMAAQCSDYVTTIIYERDPVCRLGLNSVTHMINELRQARTMNLLYNYANGTKAPASTESNDVPLYCAGRLMHLQVTNPTSMSLTPVSTIKVIPPWRECVEKGKLFVGLPKREELKYMFLNLYMLNDHMLDNTINAIRSLVDGLEKKEDDPELNMLLSAYANVKWRQKMAQAGL